MKSIKVLSVLFFLDGKSDISDNDVTKDLGLWSIGEREEEEAYFKRFTNQIVWIYKLVRLRGSMIKQKKKNNNKVNKARHPEFWWLDSLLAWT